MDLDDLTNHDVMVALLHDLDNFTLERGECIAKQGRSRRPRRHRLTADRIAVDFRRFEEAEGAPYLPIA